MEHQLAVEKQSRGEQHPAIRSELAALGRVQIDGADPQAELLGQVTDNHLGLIAEGALRLGQQQDLQLPQNPLAIPARI